MTADAPRQIEAERILAGRYRMVRPIARGAMAEVWEARDEVLGRSVAVKMLHAHLADDESFLERFRREAIAAARLTHPNIVATYDTGTDSGVAFIVMELVPGQSLRDVLSARGALNPRRVVEIGAQVAGALDYAHRAGVVHRDIKPANILLCDDGRAMVADFGIAKAAAETVGDPTGGGTISATDLTQSGVIVGTAKYLSPEQVDGKALDGRSDVYSLGVVLYEMVCGRPPFSGDSDVALALQHLSATPLPPRQVRAGIPRALEVVVLRSLAKRPEDRYASAAELESVLLSTDLGDDEPATAASAFDRDVTPPGGVPTFTQSERSWMVPVILIVIVAMTLGIVGVIFARSDTGQNLLDLPGGGASSGQPVTVSRVTSFDPDGDGSEHNDTVGNLVDGDTSTAWTTEQYANPQFGGIKDGVGFVLQLGGSRKLRQLEVRSTNHGWRASVYVADGPQATLDGWGKPVGSVSVADGDATFDLDGHSGAAVLVWVTDLGKSTSFTATEVTLSS